MLNSSRVKASNIFRLMENIWDRCELEFQFCEHNKRLFNTSFLLLFIYLIFDNFICWHFSFFFVLLLICNEFYSMTMTSKLSLLLFSFANKHVLLIWARNYSPGVILKNPTNQAVGKVASVLKNKGKQHWNLFWLFLI